MASWGHWQIRKYETRCPRLYLLEFKGARPDFCFIFRTRVWALGMWGLLCPYSLHTNVINGFNGSILWGCCTCSSFNSRCPTFLCTSTVGYFFYCFQTSFFVHIFLAKILIFSIYVKLMLVNQLKLQIWFGLHRPAFEGCPLGIVIVTEPAGEFNSLTQATWTKHAEAQMWKHPVHISFERSDTLATMLTSFLFTTITGCACVSRLMHFASKFLVNSIIK